MIPLLWFLPLLLLAVQVQVQGSSEMMDTFKRCVVNNQKELRVKCFIENTDIFDKSTPVPILKRDEVTNLFPKIPADQFNSFWGVSFSLIALGWYWSKDGVFPQLLKALGVYAIILFLPRYFGYKFLLGFSFKCSTKLIVAFKKIDYSRCQKFVSFRRWAITPFFWLCQIFTLTPKDTYMIFVDKYGLPPPNVMLAATIMSLLFVIGIFDKYQSFLQYIFTKK